MGPYRMLLLAAALAAPCAAARAADAPAWGSATEAAGQGDDRVQDPDMAAALEAADSSNLDNAMAAAQGEARAALENVLALAASARGQGAGVLAVLRSLPRGAQGEGAFPDEEDAVHLSGQMLGEREAAFRLKAASASLRVPEIDPDRLASRRRGYKSKDRGRDLVKARDYARKAASRYPASLAGEELELLDALEAWVSEVQALRAALADATEALASRQREGRNFYQAFTAVQKAAAALDADILDLVRESEMLGLQLRLLRHEAAAFESKPGR